MFAANPVDPSLTYPIHYVADPTNAVPVRRPSLVRRSRGPVAVLAAAILIIAAGAAASDSVAGKSAADRPVRGEFRLAPGNQVPPGVIVPLRAVAGAPLPGEFRLAPGNQVPPGVMVPLR